MYFTILKIEAHHFVVPFRWELMIPTLPSSSLYLFFYYNTNFISLLALMYESRV